MKRRVILKQILIRLLLLPSTEAVVGCVTVSQAGPVPPLMVLTVWRKDSDIQQSHRHFEFGCVIKGFSEEIT